MKRYIRLKEYEPGSEGGGLPADSYPADTSLERNRAYVIRADQDGFIETGNDLGEAKGSLVFLGDSVIENAMVDARHRICSHLERALFDADLPVRVLNGGYSGATTLHALNVLLNKIARLKPLAVVYVAGIVDLRVCCRPETFWSPQAEMTPLVNDRIVDAGPNSPFDLRPMIRMLELFDLVGRRIDVPIWFTTTPVQRRKDAEFFTMFPECGGLDWLVSKVEEMNDEKRRLFGDGSTPFFDLDRVLVDPATAFYDSYHFNQAGSERAAQAFVDEGLLDAVRRVLA